MERYGFSGINVVCCLTIGGFNTPPGSESNFTKGGTSMKSIFSKFLFILCAGAFVLGLAACKQAEEPEEVEVEEVEVEEVAPADTDMTDSMAEPTVQSTVQDTGGTEVEVDETVEETVESVDDAGNAAPDSATDDAEKKGY